MKSTEVRLSQLEKVLSPEKEKPRVICTLFPGDVEKEKKAEGLKKYNTENGTAFRETEVDWIVLNVVYEKKGGEDDYCSQTQTLRAT